MAKRKSGKRQAKREPERQAKRKTKGGFKFGDWYAKSKPVSSDSGDNILRSYIEDLRDRIWSSVEHGIEGPLVERGGDSDILFRSPALGWQLYRPKAGLRKRQLDNLKRLSMVLFQLDAVECEMQGGRDIHEIFFAGLGERAD